MPSERDIYSVSRLNSEVRAVLDNSFPPIWIEGEISNLARPASGHLYFSLKDAHAQVRCALFRNRRMNLRHPPANGDQVLLRARISLYEGRGEFQLIVERLEAAGEGALRRAFDELKRRLDAEGLFAAEHKRPLPPYPDCIGVVTSPSGAALRDVIDVLRRRWPLARLIVYPSTVQGADAPRQLIQALHTAARRKECDLLILTRGGGSLEDLAAFNDEQLARVIHALGIPLISAVGHEIDFTIADFVADRRAPTPSAAAELATPEQAALRSELARRERRLRRAMQQRLATARHAHRLLETRLMRHQPEARLRQGMQRLDELNLRMRRAVQHRLRERARLQAQLRQRLLTQSPARRVARRRAEWERLRTRLARAMPLDLARRRQRLASLARALETVGPLGTLQRGYAIVSDESGRVLRDASALKPGDPIRARLARGSLTARVEAVEE